MNDINKKRLIQTLQPQNIKFELDEFEQIRLMDLMDMSEEIKIKLHRDLTSTFNNWLTGSHRRKDQIKVNIKGRPRSGKSLIGMKIIFVIDKLNGRMFDVEQFVCANQKVLKKKLQKTEFSFSYLVDENAFANVGAGSMTEMLQLKDINNIIAKNNNNLVYITPNVFLNTGAPYSLEYFGKDLNNWVSRFLIYDTSKGMPLLLGYVVFDIGSMFIENGCLVFKELGGCTNPKRKIESQINKELIKNSDCIPENYDVKDLDDSTKSCPFYNICKSQMCKYEHIKDEWIEKEMKGGLDVRDYERLEVGFELFKQFYDPATHKLTSKNAKELRVKIKLKIPSLTSSKFTGVEMEEISILMFSLLDISFLKDVCGQLDLNLDEEIAKLNYLVPSE